MFDLLPDVGLRDRRRILLLGAHSDDIEIGCGATISRLSEEAPDAEVRWVVFSAIGPRQREARESAKDFLAAFATTNVELHEFRDAYFPDQFTAIKNEFEQLKTNFTPDLVFTHVREDMHQDHRLISELTWNTFRSGLILEYEIPKYEGDLGNPNLFVAISPEQLESKVEKLFRHFGTQRHRQWFSRELFTGLAHLRGLHGGSPSGLAEAFYCRKALITSAGPKRAG
jgi:LmbE family N-acetylglucosaminyl deacetylase